jgi:hypothetical protein
MPTHAEARGCSLSTDSYWTDALEGYHRRRMRRRRVVLDLEPI